MNNIYQDIHQFPKLFRSTGGANVIELEEWIKSRKIIIPRDLKSFWLKIGGCDLFESETILFPFGDKNLGDDVDSVNNFHQCRGIPVDYLIFHTGLGGISVIDAKYGLYKNVDKNTYNTIQSFNSLEEWYEKLIRCEYATRYSI